MQRAGRPALSTGVVITAVSVAVSFLTVCVAGVGAAGASASPAASGSATTWAYGALRNVSFSGTIGAYVYSGSWTIGFDVVLTETPVGSNGYFVQVNRTMGALLSVQYCRPSCAHPVVIGTVDHRSWESVIADLNLTSAGSVYVNGSATPSPGLALENSSLAATAGIRDLSTLVHSGSTVYSKYVDANLSVTSSTEFTPPLGLLPLNITPGETWTSTSDFTETGTVDWAVAAAITIGPVAPRLDDSGTIPLLTAGAVTVSGDDPGVAVRLGGTTFNALNLTIAGPFSLREGFVLLPSSSNLFGGSPPTFVTNYTNVSATSTMSQANIDALGKIAGGSHLGFGGSGMWWNSGTANPAAVVTGTAGDAPAAAPAASGANATYLQGGPESVGQATTDGHCLATGLGCPSSGGARGFLLTVVVVGAVVVVVALLAVLVAERRRVPPTSYPNAGLYPPGPGATDPRTGAPRPPSPPTGEDDPLGHLW